MSRWPTLTDEEFFWARVQQGDGCWEWSGARYSTGYGEMRGKQYAHRYSWEIANEQKAGAGQVLHHCDNPPCVNPAHLYLGNDADNRRDARERRRFNGGGQGPSKLNARQVVEIRNLRAGVYREISQEKASEIIANQYGVSRYTIRNILCGKNWKHL